MQLRPASIATARPHDRPDGAPGADHATGTESAASARAAMASWPGGIGEEPAFDQS